MLEKSDRTGRIGIRKLCTGMRLLTLSLSCWGAMGAQGQSANESVAALPGDEAYVVVNEQGQLSVNGQRRRFWAVIGKLSGEAEVKPGDSAEVVAKKVADARKTTQVLLDRFEYLGFNSARFWDGFPVVTSYEVGDGSRADSVDYFLAEAGKRGLRIWMAGMNKVGEATQQDVSIIDDAATAEAWAAAVGSFKNKKMPIRKNLARIWDPRLQAIGIRDMSNIATHLNRHNGLRWCDDPTIAVWELSNEEWWMRRMLSGGWQELPAYFKNQLIEKWNGYLQEKYKTDEALAAAWGGLLTGETLGGKSVVFAPMAKPVSGALSINDASPIAQQAVGQIQETLSRENFSAARGADVLEFLMGLQLAHKQKEAAAIKALGKSTRLSPMIYDTGIGYEIQSQFLHQNADAVSHDAYVNGTYRIRTEEEIAAEVAKATTPVQRLQKQLEMDQMQPNDGPWVNWLAKPPLIAQGVPWLEHNRVAGKPYLAYETQIMNPAKYRADFPLRLAALASIQDWDWVCWHYFGDPSLNKAGQMEKPFEKAMDISTGSHPQGYHYTYDEVQSAMMRAAGTMFVQESLPPAANPTTFVYGRRSLYDPETMTYAGSYGRMGLDMIYTTYQHGVRIKIDPSKEENEVIGPVVNFDDRKTHNPYTPNESITFDWKKAYLKMDAAEGAAFTGLMANYGDVVSFSGGSGVTLSDVTIVNPEGIHTPVKENERYVSFGIYSQDNQPISQSKMVSVSLVSTSFNSGFTLGGDGVKSQAGSLPVMVARVGGTVSSPAIEGMRYVMKDWNGADIGSGKVEGGKLHIPADKAVFVIELSR